MAAYQKFEDKKSALQAFSPASTSVPTPGCNASQDASSARPSAKEDQLVYEYLPDAAPPVTSFAKSYKAMGVKTYITFAVVAVLAMCTSLVYFQEARPRIWDPDLRREYSMEPPAKHVIRCFDAYNMARGGRDDPATFRANVELYLTQDLVYDSVGFGTWRTPAGWARGEEHNYGMAFPETIFTQMLFFGDDKVATTTTYGRALWKRDLFGVKAPQRFVNLRITDFYALRRGEDGVSRVYYNFMMIDWADVLRQIGQPLLPPAVLSEGLVLPPAANDGVPAPLSLLVVTEGRNATEAEAVVNKALLQDWAGEEDVAAQSWHEDLTFYGPGGIGLAPNASAYRKHVLAPFRQAFKNRYVEKELMACEGNYCAVFGHLCGTGVASWLGLPTSGREVKLRFGMHWRVVEGKAKEGWAIFDMPGLFEQLDLNFYDMAAAKNPAA